MGVGAGVPISFDFLGNPFFSSLSVSVVWGGGVGSPPPSPLVVGVVVGLGVGVGVQPPLIS